MIHVLLVHDDPDTLDGLQGALLTDGGFAVEAAETALAAAETLLLVQYDVIVLDVLLPDGDGREIVRALRADPGPNRDTPVIAVTAHGADRKSELLAAGADDFVQTPVDGALLIQRIRTQYEKVIAKRTPMERTAAHQDASPRERWLQRFLPSGLVDAYLRDPDSLRQHRSELACVFFDLRSFTPFARAEAPEVVVAVIAEYHNELEPLVVKYRPLVGGFAGDGVMVYFNDLEARPDAATAAAQLALEFQSTMRPVIERWEQSGYSLGLGAGVAWGWATMADIGFSTRRDYTPLGPVVNIASRLCGAAQDGEVLIESHLRAQLDRHANIEDVTADREPLKGFPHEHVFRLLGMR